MHPSNSSPLDLQATAKQIMLEHGFEPEFPAAVSAQLAQLKQNPPAVAATGKIRDLRNLLWSSIDNDTSRDLDQIEVAAPVSNGDVKIMIGIADVDAFAAKQSPIDRHASCETTTVYTGVRNFPMLPEELSTGVTSLLEDQDRLSVVYEFVVDSAGNVKSPDIYRAVVKNRAQLQYNSVGTWLESAGVAPTKVANSNELQQQLKLQDDVAQRLRKKRQENGA